MSFEDLKTSILVNRQLPEFVRDEYPKFITFLEAYYEFLEAQANTAVTSNNLVTTAKSLRYISDVDDSIDAFEKNFYNTYAAIVPLDVQANKALLFKQLLPLYKTKGSENSFKLLFQLVFGEDIDVILPKNNVLRASASDWQVDNKLRINPDISSNYTGDGTTKTFYLAQQVGTDEVSIFVNGVLKSAGVDYFINKEYRQLNFITAPANGATIRATYDNFNIALLNNRKVTGITSKASAIIESASRRIISDTLNLGLPVELLITAESLSGSFLNGETITIPINDEINNISIDIRASTFSIIRRLNVVNAGNNYSVGDIVSVFGGNASTNAFGTVERVVTGEIDTVQVHHGGASFTILSPISVSGNNPFSTMTIVVDAIDASGANAANSFTVSPDVISNLNTQIAITNSNWGSAFSKANISASNTIADALNYITLQVGPISNISVLSSTVPLTEKNIVRLDAAGAQYGANVPYRYSKSLRSIGRYKINAGGTNYKVGDEIIFGSNPPSTYGQHAAATVTRVAANGYILRIDSANSRIRGTGTTDHTGTTIPANRIAGTSTFFTQDLKIGDKIDINNESRIVTTINNDLSVDVDVNFTYSTTNKKIGVYNRWPLGGYGYTQNNFPSISVSSATGSGANVQIDSLVGDGERLSATGFGANGQIVSIKVVNPGSGYEFNPIVSVSGGDGTATANAEIERSYVSAPGRWITSDSIISSTERKIQGEDYYVDYSYIISSQTEFSKYKQMLKQLLHPVGMVNYAFFNTEKVVELTDVTIQDVKTNTISGIVSVGNGRIVVAGTNTKYNIANTRGILSLGSTIAVNGELRTINTIVSNTTLLTTSNISNLRIANSGSGYSNGYLVFSDGGGQVTSLTITAAGSGYENGFVSFSGTDEAIAAVANVEVYASNGAVRTLTLVSGGLYSGTPIAIPDSNPHRVVYANGISIVSRGEGYSNGWLVFSGGSPLRDANASVEVFPSNGAIRSITVYDSGLYQSNPTVRPDSNANVVISSVSVANVGNAHSNGVLTFSGGNPKRAAVVRVEVYPANGSIRRVTIVDPGLYSTTPTAVLNTTPVSISSIAANTATYNGRFIANGYLVFSGGNPVRDANVSYEVYSANGVIRSFTINDAGLYRSTPTATPNVTPVSITEVYPVQPGLGYVNGNVIFTTSQGTANITANATVTVNGTGAISSIVINTVGLYANGADVIVYGILNPATSTVQSPTYPASFRIGYAANTLNVANLVVTTTANGQQTANVTITANSNTYTNATFSVVAVPNVETSAVITVGFTGRNTAANVAIEVYDNSSGLLPPSNTVNGEIVKLTINSPGNYYYTPNVTPNSAGSGALITFNPVSWYQTANAQTAIIFN
jgi:hypothetical protein